MSLKRVHALFERFVYLFYGRFQVFGISVLAVYNFFPVPLVYVKRMKIVAYLVATDGVHVGIETAVGFEAVFVKSEPLPFSEAVYDFCDLSGLLNVERYGAFYAVEVVVESAFFEYEKGR